MSILVNVRDKEPIIVKKAKHFVSFKFGNIHLLDNLNFPCGASSLEAYKTKETKSFFPCEWFDCSEKTNNKKLAPYDTFFNILHKSNPLEIDYNDFQNLVKSGLATEQAVAKLRMDRIPATGAEILRICKASGRIRTGNISKISSSGVILKMLFWH